MTINILTATQPIAIIEMEHPLQHRVSMARQYMADNLGRNLTKFERQVAEKIFSKYVSITGVADLDRLDVAIYRACPQHSAQNNPVLNSAIMIVRGAFNSTAPRVRSE